MIKGLRMIKKIILIEVVITLLFVQQIFSQVLYSKMFLGDAKSLVKKSLYEEKHDIYAVQVTDSLSIENEKDGLAFRGIQADITTFVFWTSCSVSVDIDCVKFWQGSVGVRVGLERLHYLRFYDERNSEFLDKNIMGRYSITLSVDRLPSRFDIYLGYTYRTTLDASFILRDNNNLGGLWKVGAEFSFMFIEKIFGLLTKVNVCGNDVSGVLGIVIGWRR
jgi:hypothetical protein